MNDSDAFGPIVVATDGSVDSAVAVEHGIRLAQGFGTSVAFVSVRKPPYPVLGDPYYTRAVSRDLQRARNAVNQAIALARENGIEAEGEVLEGVPAPEIILFARARDAEMIVVGCRGLGAVKRSILGSVSSAVVHHADRPVLVARRSTAPAAAEATREPASAARV